MKALADLLPTAISILIGFTVTLITLLLTSSGENIDNIKKIITDKKVHGKVITLYQGLHIQFSHLLFSEVLLFLRALYKKYPQSDNMPSVDQIERKIYDSLRNTIVMSRYKYDDNLEDSIFKASLILNLQEYRNNNEVKREAEKIRMRYEESDDKETYKKIGMGKEALRQIFNWLNSEMRLNLNKDDIFRSDGGRRYSNRN